MASRHVAGFKGSSLLASLALKPNVEAKLIEPAAEEGKAVDQFVVQVLEEWLVSTGLLDIHEIEEDSPTQGSA